MAHRGVSVAMQGHQTQPVSDFSAEKKQTREVGVLDRKAARPSFATRAQAQLLDALGWQIAASPRRDAESHASLQCCFVLRDGRREEAVFGYTGQTAPLDLNDPMLRAAQSRIGYFLSFLGEDRGVLLQNTPLFAFGGGRRDRIAVFGGWRFQSGVWKPFLLGPDGLGGVAAQDTLFDRDTAPHHVAEICGHSTETVMPWIANLVQAIETLGPCEAEVDQAAESGLDFDGLQIAASASGWLSARTRRSPKISPVRQIYSTAPVFRHTDAVVSKPFWEPGGDEFQFHQFGMNRISRT